MEIKLKSKFISTSEDYDYCLTQRLTDEWDDFYHECSSSTQFVRTLILLNAPLYNGLSQILDLILYGEDFL